MDRSAVKAIVDREIESLMKRLGIQHWTVAVRYEPEAERPDGQIRRGFCSPNLDYNTAAIQFNPEAFDTEEEVLHVLRHELLHVVLSPYDLYKNALAPVLDTDPAKVEVFAVLWTHVIEKAVINLNRMYLGLTQKDEP